MTVKFEARQVGRWSVAQTKTGEALLRFSWSDEPDQTFLIPGDQAVKIAEAILQQDRHGKSTQGSTH